MKYKSLLWVKRLLGFAQGVFDLLIIVTVDRADIEETEIFEIITTVQGVLEELLSIAQSDEKRLADKLYAKDNVSFIYNTVVTALEGGKELEAIRLKNTETGKESRLTLDGAFVCIGQIPENDAFKDLVTLNEYGYFDAGEDCLTKDPAIFVAGDCRSKRIRQITTATADGAVAAIAACRYLGK